MKSLLAVSHLHQQADRILERSAAVEGMLSSLAGIKVLSRRMLLWYVATMVAGVLVVLGGFRLTRIAEWGWAVATVLALGAAVAAVVTADRYKAQPSPFLAELAMVTGSQGGRVANVQAAFGLFSPAEQDYAVETRDDAVSVQPGPSRMTPPEEFTVAYEARSVLPQLRVRADDIRLAYVRGTVNAGGPTDPDFGLPRAVVRAGADGLALEIENATGWRWEDGFLKYHRFVLPVGDLPPGQRQSRQGLRRGSGMFTSRLVHDPADELRTRLRKVFFPDPVFSLQRNFDFEQRRFYGYFREQETRPVLYAWTDQLPVSLVTIDPPVARRAVGMWAIESGLEFSGDRLLVPRGVTDLQVAGKSAVINLAGDGQFFGTRPAELALVFALPEGWPDLAIDRARLYLEFRGSAFRSQVAVRPAGGGQELVLAGDPPYEIPQPGRFYDRATRSLAVGPARADRRPDGGQPDDPRPEQLAGPRSGC